MFKISNKSGPKICLTAFAFLLAMTSLAQPRTITVGQGAGYDFSTIQAAIDDSNDGDTIIVGQGTYYENIHFNDKNIILTSTDPNDTSVVEGTVIDGGGADSVVTFSGNENPVCLLTGFTITNGNASYGGGIYGDNSKATINQCVIKNNYSSTHGGGLYGCHGTIINCIISGNTAHNEGGGLSRCYGTMVNCIIISNTAANDGGGLSRCDVTIINCIISGNTADDDGGGLDQCDVTIIHCTIADNIAGDDGGGLSFCDAYITNCIIWGNNPDQIYRYGDATYCCIQSGWNGVGNISANPLFVDAANGNYHLRTGSPCINAGDPAFIPFPKATDIDGEPRVMGTRVDIGSDEFKERPTPIIGISSAKIRFDAVEGGSNPTTQKFAVENKGWEILNWQIVEDCTWVQLDPITGNSREGPVEVTLTVDISGLSVGKHDCKVTILDTDASNSPQIITVTLYLRPDGSQIHVPSDFATIQAAIDATVDGDTIVVGPGTYYENINFNDKNIILTSTDPNDTSVVEGTVINANDTGSVVTFGSRENSSCLLTGFTLTNGNTSFGGGIDGNSTKATITRCYIVGNRAKGGGGIYRFDGLISDCIIKDNMAQRVGSGAGSGGDGGGLYRCDGNIMRCTIANNKTSDEGGGLYDCEGSIIDCIISGNEADDEGGGLGCLGSSWVGKIVNCVILNNKAQRAGGGLYHYRGKINNCIIWGNSPDQIYKQWDSDSDPTYSCVQGGWPGTGNISTNPLFVNAENGNYHLLPTSPCIDSGDPDFVPMSGETDADSEPRVMGARVDMGVDEYTSTPSIIIGVSPKKFNFKAIKYKPNPEPQILSIWNAGYRPLTWQISENCPWLDIYPKSGHSTGEVNEVAINVDISVIDGGTYSCELTITASEATNSPQTIEINLDIDQPVIALSKKLFEFFASEGGPEPPDQILSIRNSDGETLNWTITYDCNWLSVEPNAGSSTGEMDEATISVDTSCLSVGEHNCDITVSDPCAVNSPQMFAVTAYIFKTEAELHVPSEFKTIQMAIDVAKNGHTIVVAPGTYTGEGNRDLDFHGKAFTLTSIDPNDPDVVAATVIDCNDSEDELHRGFYFHSGEGPDSIISGFTITNGYIYGDANDPNAYGGAIYCNGSSPTIRNCVITDNKVVSTIYYYDWDSNTGDAFGGAIYCISSSPTIENCTITDNKAIGSDGRLYYISPDGGDAYGGATFCTLNSNPIISNCTVSYNEAKGGEGVGGGLGGGASAGGNAFGGGLYSDLGSNPMLKNCNIISNTISGGNGGRGHYCPATDAGDVYGAGIYCGSNSMMTIYYCKINNNQATGGIGGTGEHDAPGKSGNAYGGGIYAGPKSGLAFGDCRITGNTALGGKGGRFEEEGYSSIGGTGGNGYGGGICWDSNSVSMIENCLISGNLTAGGSGGYVWGWYVATGGNGGDGYAGGIYCAADSKQTSLNCTISANRAFAGEGGIGDTVDWWTGENGANGKAYGAGIYCEPNSTGIITNCIIWDNLGAKQIEGGEPNISFSDVQEGWEGQGNVDDDPLFVRLGYWADMNDLDAMLAHNDPNAVRVMGDYHLSQIAAGQQVTSPCIDAGGDLAENLGMAELTTRTDGAPDTEVVDMGYHYDRPSLADVDGDGNVDLRDYVFLGGHWQENVGLNGHREHIVEYRSRLALWNIPIGSAVIDGDWWSEWDPISCPFLDLDEAYYGEAADVHSAVYSIRWDPNSSKIYLAVFVSDEDHVFSNVYTKWDASDRIEIYVQAIPEGGTDFLGKYDIAQQYMIGPKPTGGYWATWALGEQIGDDVGFECAVKRYGGAIAYEVAIPLFDYYGGFTGQETVRAHLDPASIIGFDVVVSSRSADGFGMLSENLMTGKSQDAGQFAKYILGPVKLYMPNAGYRADFNYDGFVDWLDLAMLAEQWLWQQ